MKPKPANRPLQCGARFFAPRIVNDEFQSRRRFVAAHARTRISTVDPFLLPDFTCGLAYFTTRTLDVVTSTVGRSRKFIRWNIFLVIRVCSPGVENSCFPEDIE